MLLLKFLTEFLVRPKPDVTIKVVVKELFWNYTDHLLERLHGVGKLDSPYISIQYNNSKPDRLNTSIVYSGETDSRLTAQLIQWAGKESLGIWRNDANNITGTEGIIWQPFLDQNEEIIAFISDVQR